MAATIRLKPSIGGIALLSLLAALEPASAAMKIPDTQITVAVERQFMLDPAVPSNAIDVETRNGVVKLSGEASNLGARMQAERIAETVKGVRSVVDEVAVEPTGLPPEEIQKGVIAALAADPASGGHGLTATVDRDGTVTLRGTVHGLVERELAKRVAASVRGVRRVDADIQLDFPAKRSDSEMQADIKERLRWDTLVDDSLIDVNVKGATATLTGIVGSAAETRRARFDAGVTGIKEVKSDGLEVERWARDDDLRTAKYVKKPDGDIRNAIKAALLYDPRVNAFPLTVVVTDGIAQLSGAVGNLSAKRAATDTARNTVGVAAVENYLHVRPADHYSSATIDENVRAALRRDALIDKDDVLVVTDGGVVKLYGVVDSPIERNQAEEVASRIAGVLEVQNYLMVQRPDLAVPLPGGYGWYPYRFIAQRQTTRADDEAIAANIGREMYWSPYVNAADVQVTVDDGVATLRGSVRSRAERAAAVASAYEGGARRVKDEIELLES